MLFEFENVSPPTAPVVVPAETESDAAATVLAEIVTELPFWLKRDVVAARQK